MFVYKQKPPVLREVFIFYACLDFLRDNRAYIILTMQAGTLLRYLA